MRQTTSSHDPQALRYLKSAHYKSYNTAHTFTGGGIEVYHDVATTCMLFNTNRKNVIEKNEPRPHPQRRENNFMLV